MSHPTEQPPRCLVEIRSLRAADSPRRGGENHAHVRRLAESDANLPPILVHRPTMRVIDGMHRLAAAILCGRSEIEVQFFDGDEAAAFIVGVESNIAHGLPLSLADRKRAAARILATHPERSDRSIAASTGLSDKTVAAVRTRATAELPQSNVRIGRDGRTRPVHAADARRRATEVVETRPDCTVREIARAAGVSASTAHGALVRQRQSVEPATDRLLAGRIGTGQTKRSRVASPSAGSPQRILQDLTDDPGLKFTDQGRRLLRWLHVGLIGPGDWANLVDAVPAHCVPVVAHLARGCAESWRTLAQELERRNRLTS